MSSTPARIELHPDRLLPADPTTRAIARRLYAEVADLPIISPHGHVDAAVLADDVPFGNPAELFVTPDHYVTRMLHANGVPLRDLGLADADAPDATPADPREIWRTFCTHWKAYRATPVRSWMEAELVDVFGITTTPSAETADELYDALSDRLAQPEFQPRALYRRFNLEVLATTDDPASGLAAHRALADDPSWPGRVVPTFRPDRYLALDVAPGSALADLSSAAGVDATTYDGYIGALETRRRYFIENGGTASDHGVVDARTEALEHDEAATIFDRLLAGTAPPADADRFRRHMLTETARMAADDGLVMQVHPGVLRNHHGPTYRRFGPDRGHDIPVATEYTRALQPLLEKYGTHPNFRMVLFTVDEDAFSREVAPLAGFYPSVFVGAPWWFLDTPDAMMRFREAVTDSAGFYRTAGFVDDTRAFCSIPARHDTARRVDCSFLARLVAEHRIGEDESLETARDLAYRLPKEVFRL
ncbi:MAG: glucuronate isomerase [Mycobacteriales bacterium]